MARLIAGRFLFIHAAKTGGTFFREAIHLAGIPSIEIGKKHAPYSEVRKLAPEAIPIMFVRHPATWYRSRWAFGKMTYFGEKIKYMPEAQAHWMAPVWSENFQVFVENILNHYDEGPATTYFKGMMPRWDFEPFKYEELAISTQEFINDLLGGYRFPVDLDKIGRPLDSRKVEVDFISAQLLANLLQMDSEFIKYYYSEQIQY